MTTPSPRHRLDAIDTILAHEGGYQDDKEDRGNYNGAGQLVGTNYGISAPVLEQHRGQPVSKRDMEQLSEAEARDIYEQRYSVPLKSALGVDESHPQWEHLLDMSVNHGLGNTVAVVQRATGAKVDGKAGPKTRAAVARAGATFGTDLVERRKDFYNQIMKSRPEMERYRNGWMNRAESFRP